MSNLIGDELAAIVADLAAAGIPATTSPAEVWALAAAGDTAALVERPEQVQMVTLDPRIQFTVPVHLVARGPDPDAQLRLLAALPAALIVLIPRDPAEPTRYSIGEAQLLAYTIPATRTVKGA